MYRACTSSGPTLRQVKTAKLGNVRPWHESKLSIAREIAIASGDGDVRHGDRWAALRSHFCALPPGKLDLVRAHWRGNADKGIAPQKTHRVTHDSLTA